MKEFGTSVTLLQGFSLGQLGAEAGLSLNQLKSTGSELRDLALNVKHLLNCRGTTVAFPKVPLLLPRLEQLYVRVVNQLHEIVMLSPHIEKFKRSGSPVIVPKNGYCARGVGNAAQYPFSSHEVWSLPSNPMLVD
ncbi:hypothetical protein Acr_23g0011880 [Actinidia rufa]|uniref:Uncharacterized protein n=1 Tax=Actinidia rufa TaxID=165716 RepID=A0A7J0GPT9_9ERIC|nr:hypothetical protein Acr_23g0011880 [Actinidia rufa]